jgi:sugar phosphate isomerase/epimerase
MPRPFTLFTGQWADLPLEEVCRLASSWGYDGLELACWGDHFEVDRALSEDGYLAGRHELLDKYGLRCLAISCHLVGQAVCDHPIDERHQAILPARIWGDGSPEGVRQRAAAEVADTARAAAAFGVRTVIGFTGSSIWHTVAMFPPVPESMIERGYADFADRWNPILDVFDAEGVRFAHEVHPSEIAYDFWTAKRALAAVGNRPAFGLNFDPSHFVWQDLDGLQGGAQAAGRPQRAARLAPAVGRPAARLGLRVGRARRRAVGGRVPDAELDRLRRADLGGVGGRGHGPPAGGARVARLPAPVRLRAAFGVLRRGVQQRSAVTRRWYGRRAVSPPARPVDR